MGKFYHVVVSRYFIRIQFFILLIFTIQSAFSQSNTRGKANNKNSSPITTVRGKVIDRETGKPLPFVTIVFKKTPLGVTTDTLGNYVLTAKIKVDSIQFSTVGYIGQTFAVKQNTINELTVKLKPEMFNISEVTVQPDDSPTRRLLKEVVKHKKQNNPAKYSRYAYRKYTKWEYHLNNVGPKMINSRAFKNNPSVFKTNPGDSTKFLPIYFSEQIVYNEVQRNPSRQKSTVLGDKTSGVGVLNDLEISGYTSALDMEVNFYDNYITLFTQNFVSPLADNGWFYYKYFLTDSTYQKGVKVYRVRFIPKRVGDKVFKGYMTIETKGYSVLDVDGQLSNTSYLNFLKNMRLASSYQMVDDSIPFFKRNQIDAVFDYIPLNNNPTKKPISLFFTQSSVIDSVAVNQKQEVRLTTNNGHYETITLPDAKDRDDKFWDGHRLEELNEREKMVTNTIDSVSNIKAVKFVDNIARMSMTGYYDLGKFEFGPYASTIGENKVEGLYLFAGARTSSEISNRFMVWGGLGYGFKNQRVNAMGGLAYKFPTIHRQMAKISYDDKIIRTGENEKILYLYENATSATENNLISQVFTRNELDELFRERKVSSSYEYEWHSGLINKISASYIRHYSPEYYPFMQSGSPVSNVSALDFIFDTRFSWYEKVVDNKFLRLYMKTNYPIIHFSIGGGKVFYPGGSNYYGKILTTIKQYWRIGQTGLNYAVEGGAYFGKMPYTMLDIPRGNETWGYFTYDFNLLNYLEFVHDKYLHAYMEYHMNGFFFNRMPLLKRLGLREVFSAKGMIGSFNNKNLQIVELPLSVTQMSNPYIEVGAGVENILKLFRVEAIWRVRPKSVLDAPSFGIRAKFEIKL